MEHSDRHGIEIVTSFFGLEEFPWSLNIAACIAYLPHRWQNEIEWIHMFRLLAVIHSVLVLCPDKFVRLILIGLNNRTDKWEIALIKSHISMSYKRLLSADLVMIYRM